MGAFLYMANWNEWQSYRKDRGTPPWIKIHRNLMSNSKWAHLTDAEKGHLISIWIIAADNDGRVPDDARLLKKMCQIDDLPNLNRFQELGWMTTTCQPNDNQEEAGAPQDDIPEAEAEAEAEKKEKIKKEIFVLPLPGWLPLQDWNDYLEMRNGKGKGKATDRAKQLIIIKLDELRKSGQDPGEVLQQSIVNGWTSVFEIKKDYQNGSGYKKQPDAHSNFTAGIALALTETGRQSGY